MKSTTYPSLVIAALCLLLASAALAQESVTLEADASVETEQQTEQGAARAEIQANQRATTQTREAAVAERAEVRGEQQAEVQAQREARQSELSQRAKERVTNLAANISNRMDAAAARMQNIITRLESRIDKLAAAGLDTTEASAALASAQTSIDAAVVDLAGIDIIVQAAVTAENPRAAWEEARATYGSIRAQLRTAHTEIKASVQALKDAARTTDSERGSAAAVQNNTEVQADQEAVSVTSESEGITE